MSAARSGVTTRSGIVASHQAIPTTKADQMLQAYGYVRKHFLMNDGEVASAEGALAKVAAQRDAELMDVLVEDLANSPDAFEAVLSLVLKSRDRILVVPTEFHLDANGESKEVRKRLEANGITVISGDELAEPARDDC